MSISLFTAKAALAVAAAGLATVAATAPAHAGAPPAVRLPRLGLATQGDPSIAGPATRPERDWPFAGYIASADQIASLTYVSTEFTVPVVHCEGMPAKSRATFWVGISGGGINNSPNGVEQTGVTDQCLKEGGDPSYYAWWEMYPDPPHNIPWRVEPGDKIRVEVADLGINSSFNDVYELAVFDLTSHPAPVGRWSFIQKEVCNTCNDPTAEVIAEGYNYANSLGPVNFGQVNFTHSVIDDDGANPTANIGQPPDNAWYVTAVEDAHDRSNDKEIVDMVPGPLTDNGASFSVKWLSDK
jgi:hypothetical protein